MAMSESAARPKQLNVLLPEETHRRFKAHVAMKGTSMRAEIERLIQEVCQNGG